MGEASVIGGPLSPTNTQGLGETPVCQTLIISPISIPLGKCVGLLTALTLPVPVGAFRILRFPLLVYCKDLGMDLIQTELCPPQIHM